MPNVKNIFKTSAELDKDFMDSYEVDQNKCWVWKHRTFRFRHDLLIMNPRHYALQMEGYVLEKGRNYTAGCGNPMCVNPDHTRLMHDGSSPDKGLPLYLDLGRHHPKYGNIYSNDFQFPNSLLAKKYHVTKKEVDKARDRTFELIEEVKPSKIGVERLANQFHVAPSYIRQVKALTMEEFRRLEDESVSAATLFEAAEVDLEGLKFKRRIHK